MNILPRADPRQVNHKLLLSWMALKSFFIISSRQKSQHYSSWHYVRSFQWHFKSSLKWHPFWNYRLSVCLAVFTQATLCTTTIVYGVLVHQQGAICTTKAQYAPWCTRETMCLSVIQHSHVWTVWHDVSTSFDNFWARILTRRARRGKARQRSGIFICNQFDWIV